MECAAILDACRVLGLGDSKRIEEARALLERIDAGEDVPVRSRPRSRSRPRPRLSRLRTGRRTLQPVHDPYRPVRALRDPLSLPGTRRRPRRRPARRSRSSAGRRRTRRTGRRRTRSARPWRSRRRCTLRPARRRPRSRRSAPDRSRGRRTRRRTWAGRFSPRVGLREHRTRRRRSAVKRLPNNRSHLRKSEPGAGATGSTEPRSHGATKPRRVRHPSCRCRSTL